MYAAVNIALKQLHVLAFMLIWLPMGFYGRIRMDFVNTSNVRESIWISK